VDHFLYDLSAPNLSSQFHAHFVGIKNVSDLHISRLFADEQALEVFEKLEQTHKARTSCFHFSQTFSVFSFK
jgi:hypothetical protein